MRGHELVGTLYTALTRGRVSPVEHRTDEGVVAGRFQTSSPDRVWVFERREMVDGQRVYRCMTVTPNRKRDRIGQTVVRDPRPSQQTLQSCTLVVDDVAISPLDRETAPDIVRSIQRTWSGRVSPLQHTTVRAQHGIDTVYREWFETQ
jgi:hypothetical protein